MARTTGSIGVETHKRVLKEALSLFAREGYAAVSTRQIASACGLQVGALYNHFPNKQSILSGLMIDHMQSLIEALQNESFPDDPQAALETFARFHIRYHIDKPEEVFIAYMELRNLETEPLAQVTKLRQQYERHLRNILREGNTRGIFQIADVPVAAMAIISMMTGVNSWFRYGGRLSVAEIEEIYVNMIMSVVRGETNQQTFEQLEEMV